MIPNYIHTQLNHWINIKNKQNNKIIIITQGAERNFPRIPDNLMAIQTNKDVTPKSKIALK